MAADESGGAAGDATPRCRNPRLHQQHDRAHRGTVHGPYIASKAAGEAFAESIGLEVTQFGIDTIIMVPGAFTQGTQHFAHTTAPAEPAVVAQYGDLAAAVAEIPARLEAIDIAHQGHTADVSSVGDALVDVLGQPRGSRPRRVIVDAQHKGVEDIEAIRTERQRAFFTALGIDRLIDLPDRP